MRTRAILAVVMFLTAGCEKASSSSGEPDSLTRAARSGAEFRYYARFAYEALVTESCRERPALPRDRVLARERAAMGELEERFQSQPAGAHLAMARSDVAYAREAGKLGCWDDSNPGFAALHVRIARDRVRGGLEEMHRLATAVISLSRTTNDNPLAAQFRSSARELVILLEPLCLTHRESAQILGAARAELARLRENLRGTPFALHFAVAESDARYELSITSVDCGDAAASPPGSVSGSALAETRQRIASLLALTRT